MSAHMDPADVEAALIKPGDVIMTREQWDALPVGTVWQDPSGWRGEINERGWRYIRFPDGPDIRQERGKWTHHLAGAANWPVTVASVPESLGADSLDDLDRPPTPVESAHSAWLSFTDAVRALDAGQREELWVAVAFEQNIRPVLADPRTWER